MTKHAYDAKTAEKKWQDFWLSSELYRFAHRPGAKVFAIDTPPPTVSGKMHLGHAFSYAQQDFIARYKRMRGFNVFYPFGTDDNGLPTEKLVEAKKKILSSRMSREDFVRICNDVIEEEKPKFVQSWMDIGVSADFKHSYSTIDRHCQVTSQASFIDLYEKGRVYQQDSPGAYCVSCQTAIAQAEFESVELKSHFHEIRFEVDGQGGKNGQSVVIATTRPELLPACVALFYHPADERYQNLKGRSVRVPIFGHEVPVLEDPAVQMDKGTGIMMVCTFGDKEDIDKWFRHKLPLRVIFSKDGKLGDLAAEFKGLKIKEARAKIVERLRESGELVAQREIVHDVNVHERCKTEVEYLRTAQWYIRVLDEKENLLRLGAQLRWYPEHMKVRYDHWVQNLNWDWCISRQRHFGIPIPVWKCAKCEAVVLPSRDELPVDPSVTSPKQRCSCGSEEYVGETDVLDTWATSSVTPEIAANWVDDGAYEFEFRDEPFDLRPQAHDIIRTWLFYTIVKSFYHHGRLPWASVMISGHAQDPKGKKMSKSLGNIVEPQQMIIKYSADALRFWAAGSKLGEDLPFQEKDLVTGVKTALKLYNAANFVFMQLDGFDRASVPELGILDRALLSALADVVERCTLAFDEFDYSRPKFEVELFFWRTFCDQYLEIVKDRFYNDSRQQEKAAAQYVLYHALYAVLQLFAPIVPHITEELYQQYYAKDKGAPSIHVTSWPQRGSKDETAQRIARVVFDIIDEARKFKSTSKVSLKTPIVAKIEAPIPKDWFEMVRRDVEGTIKAEHIEFIETDNFNLVCKFELAGQ